MADLPRVRAASPCGMVAWRRCTSRSATLSGVCAKLVAQMMGKITSAAHRAAATAVAASLCEAQQRDLFSGILFINNPSSCTSTSLYLICSTGCKQNSYDFFGDGIDYRVERGVLNALACEIREPCF